MFRKMKHAWHWSKAMDLYFDQNAKAFLKEIEIYSSKYELTDFESVVVANAKILAGRNGDAKTDFVKLASVMVVSQLKFNASPIVIRLPFLYA